MRPRYFALYGFVQTNKKQGNWVSGPELVLHINTVLFFAYTSHQGWLQQIEHVITVGTQHYWEKAPPASSTVHPYTWLNKSGDKISPPYNSILFHHLTCLAYQTRICGPCIYRHTPQLECGAYDDWLICQRPLIGIYKPNQHIHAVYMIQRLLDLYWIQIRCLLCIWSHLI